MSVATGCRCALLSLAALLGLLFLFPASASAQSSANSLPQSLVETTELAVNGPEGALLLMDGQAMGQLPLPLNLVVPAGPHRFRLELGKQKGDSDLLPLPANGLAELNLTLSGRTLIAVLRITDGLLLLLSPESLSLPLKSAATAAVASAAKLEHSILLGGERQAQLLLRRAALLRCIDQGDCHEAPFREGQVSYVLSLRLADGGGGGLRGSLLDARTRDLSAQGELPCAPCDGERLAASAERLTRQLLQTTTSRPRSTISVAAKPAGAKVLLDGRWLGVAPLTMEAFAGARQLEVSRDGYQTQRQELQVDPSQPTTLTVELAPNPEPVRPPKPPRPPSSRPLWRLVTGGVMVGGGLLLLGLGGSALATDGACLDGTSNTSSCPDYYSTAPVGGGLLGAGALLTVGGVLMMAIPNRPSTP